MTAKQNPGSQYAPDGSRYITLTDGAGNLVTTAALTGVTVGSTSIASGTTTKVLYDNAGVLGEYTVSGSGNVALTTSPVLTTPLLGTPTSGVLTNCTGTASGLTAGTASAVAVGGITGLGSGVGTFLATPSRSNLNTALTGSLPFVTLVTPSSPTGTASTAAFKMAGLGSSCTFTPTYSTRMMVCFCGCMYNTTINDGGLIQVAYGTSTAPANAAAATGTVVGNFVEFATSAAANQVVPFCINVIITGLTLATTYWVDLQFEAITGGTFNLQGITYTAHEV